MRISRKIAAGAAVVTALTGSGVAFAAWTATGGGTGYAKAVTANAITTVDVSASATADLYPGKTGGSLLVKFSNSNSYDVTITGLAQTGSDASHFVSSSGGLGACTDDPATETTPGNPATLAHPTGVSFTGWASPADGSAIVVPHGGAVQVTLSKVNMTNSSDNNCQGATFSIPVSITAGASS